MPHTCACTCACTCLDTCLYTCLYTCPHKCLVSLCIPRCLPLGSICVHIVACSHTHPAHVHAGFHAHGCTRVCTRVYAPIRAYAWFHVCTYVHTHVCKLSRRLIIHVSVYMTEHMSIHRAQWPRLGYESPLLLPERKGTFVQEALPSEGVGQMGVVQVRSNVPSHVALHVASNLPFNRMLCAANPAAADGSSSTALLRRGRASLAKLS